jgi:hypothetical protein
LIEKPTVNTKKYKKLPKIKQQVFWYLFFWDAADMQVAHHCIAVMLVQQASKSTQ